jgi:DnaJ homolog subfamily A member 2
MTQALHECPNCNGTGQVFRDKDKCKRCHGAKTVTEKKLLELYIPHGSKTGDRIVLAGEADQSPEDDDPGDLVFVIKEKQHDVFQRRGNDLCAEITVTLAEALTGLDRVVLTHLDGRGISIKVEQPKGKILTPGQVLKISGEGMRVKKSDAKGDLYLCTKVEFPADGWIKDSKTIDVLRNTLPRPDPPIEAAEVEECDFEPATLEDFFEKEDDDDAGEWEDDDGGGEGIPQCAPQ